MKKKFLVVLYFVLILGISSSVIVESIFAQSNSSNVKMSDEGYSQLMLEAFKFIKGAYVEPVDEDAIFEGALKGMFNALNDPYSQYLTRKDLLEISKTTHGNYVGIGISIVKKNVTLNSSNSVASYVMVISPFEDGPAYKAGIKAGDYITAVDGKSTNSMTLEKFTELLGGEAGTKVKISVLRGEDLNLEFEICREKLDIKTVKHDVINKDVGYIKIISFNPNTNVDFRKAFEKLQEHKIKSLILDLRWNAGGYLQDAIKIADDILTEGIIVSTKSRDSNVPIEYKATSSHIVPLNMKIVTLIDRNSASASEVLVGALKDNNRVYVIGEKSYGKGVIQRILRFYTGGFKITHSKYYTPSGNSIHNVGIKPDLEVGKSDYSDDEISAYKQIFDKNFVENFLKGKKNKKSITEDEIDSFVDNAVKKYSSRSLEIDKDMLGYYLFFQFYQHTDSKIPVYNLRYDRALKTAYEYLLKETKN